MGLDALLDDVLFNDTLFDDALLDCDNDVQYLLQVAAKLEMGSELIEVSFGPIS